MSIQFYFYFLFQLFLVCSVSCNTDAANVTGELMIFMMMLAMMMMTIMMMIDWLIASVCCRRANKPDAVTRIFHIYRQDHVIVVMTSELSRLLGFDDVEGQQQQQENKQHQQRRQLATTTSAPSATSTDDCHLHVVMRIPAVHRSVVNGSNAEDRNIHTRHANAAAAAAAVATVKRHKAHR